jgi:hypothetical protein
MMLVKLSKEDGRAMEAASSAMAAAAGEENKHKKAREAAKMIIARELLQLRKISLDELPAGEVVMVQVDGRDVVKVDRKGTMRLDQEALRAAHPDVLDAFTRESVASYFSSLLK